MSPSRRRPQRGAVVRARAILGLLGWTLIILGALAVVVWRQTEGVAVERGLRDLEAQRGVAEAERVALERQVQSLGSRARVVRLARERLGMHLPAENEIIFLAMPGERPPPADTLLMARGAR